MGAPVESRAPEPPRVMQIQHHRKQSIESNTWRYIDKYFVLIFNDAQPLLSQRENNCVYD